MRRSGLNKADYIGIGFLGWIFFLITLSSLGIPRQFTFTVSAGQASTLAAIALVFVIALVQKRIELSRLRNMYLFWYSHTTNADRQALFDHVLTEKAKTVRETSESLIRLHTLGLKGVSGWEILGKDEEATYKHYHSRFTYNFKDAQNNFYLLYDQIESMETMLGKAKLKNRAWKVYAGEPTPVKRTRAS